MDTEPLLAYLRALRDDALERAKRPKAEYPLFYKGAVAAFERAIVGVGRWENGQDPDPSPTAATLGDWMDSEELEWVGPAFGWVPRRDLYAALRARDGG